eukprot:3606044-Pyramimonas_sp.AAC.1
MALRVEKGMTSCVVFQSAQCVCHWCHVASFRISDCGCPPPAAEPRQPRVKISSKSASAISSEAFAYPPLSWM